MYYNDNQLYKSYNCTNDVLYAYPCIWITIIVYIRVISLSEYVVIKGQHAIVCNLIDSAVGHG